MTPDPQLPFAAPADRPSSDDPDAKILAVINRHFSDDLRRGEIFVANQVSLSLFQQQCYPQRLHFTGTGNGHDGAGFCIQAD